MRIAPIGWRWTRNWRSSMRNWWRHVRDAMLHAHARPMRALSLMRSIRKFTMLSQRSSQKRNKRIRSKTMVVPQDPTTSKTTMMMMTMMVMSHRHRLPMRQLLKRTKLTKSNRHHQSPRPSRRLDKLPLLRHLLRMMSFNCDVANRWPVCSRIVPLHRAPVLTLSSLAMLRATQ